MKFKLEHQDKAARTCTIEFNRGVIKTPVFMPVGTYGSVKTMAPYELVDMGAEIILSNNYHLMIRPGEEIIQAHKAYITLWLGIGQS